MEKKTFTFGGITLIALLIVLFLGPPHYYAFAGTVEPVCSSASKDGDKIIIPVKIQSKKEEVIVAWGFDIQLQGLEYVDWIKSGCLAEGSQSFMCNQMSSGNVRCGSYTGNLNIKGDHTFFKLVVKKVSGAKESSISFLNFVDNLAGVQTTNCKLN